MDADAFERPQLMDSKVWWGRGSLEWDVTLSLSFGILKQQTVFKLFSEKWIMISLGHKVASWVKASSFSCRRVFPIAATCFKLMMTQILEVLKIVVNLTLKSCIWWHCHQQTFTEHILWAGHRDRPWRYDVCETHHVLKDISYIRKESTKCSTCKIVLFLTFYFDISDLEAKITNLVYLDFFFPFYISHIWLIT